MSDQGLQIIVPGGHNYRHWAVGNPINTHLKSKPSVRDVRIGSKPSQITNRIYVQNYTRGGTRLRTGALVRYGKAANSVSMRTIMTCTRLSLSTP